MVKQLFDRLGYAFIGFLLGVVVGAALWYFYDHGASWRRHAPEIHLGFKQWCLYAGAVFAGIGLIFGARTGSAAGVVTNEVFKHETRSEGLGLPLWIVVPVVAVGAFFVWHLLLRG